MLGFEIQEWLWCKGGFVLRLMIYVRSISTCTSMCMFKYMYLITFVEA